MKHVLALVCLFVLACSSGPLSVAVDRAWSPADSSEIRRAAADLNAITFESSKILFDGDDWFVARRAPENGWNGVTYRNSQRIEIHPEASSRGSSIYRVAKHEFGHALGMNHTCFWDMAIGATTGNRPCDPSHSIGVMDPVGNTDTLTAFDLAECRRVEACP